MKNIENTLDKVEQSIDSLTSKADKILERLNKRENDMSKYNSDAEHLQDIRRKNNIFELKNNFKSVAKVLLVALAVLAFTTINAQEPPRTSLGLGTTQDGVILVTLDYVNDNNTIAGFVCGTKDYADQYSAVIYSRLQTIETSDLIIGARLGYKIHTKVSIVSSLGLDIQKQVIDRNELSIWGGYMPLQISDSSKMYSAIELNVKLIKNISISTGYGTRGLQATLNYSF
mgnify:CR=1 FL=1|tara:strand:- start:1250 stop:1936 length:687 start_codon:yes stop_codon:yes gene_type:complete